MAFRDARSAVLENRVGGDAAAVALSSAGTPPSSLVDGVLSDPQATGAGNFRGVALTVHRWLKAFQESRVGRRRQIREPANKTPWEIAELIWDIFRQNPMWGRYRLAMTLWALGVFVSASTVRDILLRPRPGTSTPTAAQQRVEAAPAHRPPLS